MVAPRLGSVAAAAARHARSSMAGSFSSISSTSLPVSRAVLSSAPRAVQARSISSTTPARGSSSEGEHYVRNEPNGWLFGVKPGETPKDEGWETIYFGIMGGITLLMIAGAYRPKTSIKVWAMDKIKEKYGDA
mmetsp:Transcript_34406/g.107891  ORF Transcript_34406/g.107891 Transcript_34406/m.107891 type:complete len:133 (-) Transcript_34406:1558-1956(-)